MWCPSPNSIVETPSGRLALVVEVDEEYGEATVEWPDGERANFTFAHLKPGA